MAFTGSPVESSRWQARCIFRRMKKSSGAKPVFFLNTAEK